MAVTNIPDFMLRESGRYLQNEILQRTLYASPWLTLIEEGAFPGGIGYSPSITTFGRTLPAVTYTDGGTITNPAYDAAGFADIGSAGLGSTDQNNCDPPVIMLQMGTKKVPFTMQQFALESQRLCATDLFTAFEGPMQIEAIVNNLKFNTTFTMTEKFRRDFVYWCANKVVVCIPPVGNITRTNAGGAAGAETFNMSGANAALKTAGANVLGRLTQGLLDRWKVKLDLAGAGPTALTQENGSSVYALLCSPETSWGIKSETETRNDMRWNRDRVDDLLKAINVTEAPIRGFQHVIDMTVPRWNHNGSVWVKVEPYKIVATDVGFEATENDDYEQATAEDSIIFNKALIKETFPGAVGNTGGTDFKPVGFRGEWGWRGYLTDLNKDGRMGFFRGIFELGAIPRYTAYGAVIRHSRCNGSAPYSICQYA